MNGSTRAGDHATNLAVARTAQQAVLVDDRASARRVLASELSAPQPRSTRFESSRS